MCRGWTTSFRNSIEEKNHLVLVQIDFPVPEPLSGIDSPRALCNFKNAFQKLLCFYSPITIDLSFCLYTKDPKTSCEGSNSTTQWVSNTHHLNSLSFYRTPKAYPLCLCSVATAAKLTEASTDLVLRSPLNLWSFMSCRSYSLLKTLNGFLFLDWPTKSSSSHSHIFLSIAVVPKALQLFSSLKRRKTSPLSCTYSGIFLASLWSPRNSFRQPRFRTIFGRSPFENWTKRLSSLVCDCSPLRLMWILSFPRGKIYTSCWNCSTYNCSLPVR